MLAILWLICWATVGEAFYDDYTWYTSDDGAVNEFQSKRMARDNFTSLLRTFAQAYSSIAQEGDNEMTINKAKTKLRMVKVFQHTGSPRDFDPNRGQMLPLLEGAKYCTMGKYTKVDCNHCTCVSGQLYMCTGMVCPKVPTKPQQVEITCKEGRRRKIDSCNYCYCRNGHEICSTRDCRHNHANFYIRSKRTCREGARREMGCNRCLCYQGLEYCTGKTCVKQRKPRKRANKNKIQPLKKREQSDSGIEKLLWLKCREGTERQIDACNKCYCRLGQEYCETKDCYEEQLLYYHNLRNPKTQCEEGTYRKKDTCNYCLCLKGSELCTNKYCESEEVGYLRYKKKKECDLWDVKFIQCNRCECRGRQWVCSKKLCNGEGNKIGPYNKAKTGGTDLFYLEDCKRGEKRKLDNCNNCYCTRGKWLCDIKYCDDSTIESTEEQGPMTIPNINKSDMFKHFKSLLQNYDPWFSRPHHTMKIPKEILDAIDYIASKIIEKSKDYENVMNNENEMNDKNTEHHNIQNEDKAYPRLVLQEDCKPGNKKLIDCNVCYCSKGIWVCTNKICHQDLLVQEACKPRSKKKVDCNVCHCHKGLWSCSKKICPAPTMLRETSSEDMFERTCTIGERKRIDACNYCYCNRHREKICTHNKCDMQKKVHPTYDVTLTDERCEIGQRFRKGVCNYCYCNPDRQLICSNNKCRRSTSRRVQGWYVCHPKDMNREDDCNYCICNAVGEQVCTNMKCNLQTNITEMTTMKPAYYLNTTERACAEGSRRRVDECNSCICISGTEFCTKIDCSRESTPENITDAECEDGEPMRVVDPCNVCICHNSNILCTKKACIGRQSASWRPPPKLCNIRERYRIDNCNYCYCNAKRERVCTDLICDPKKVDTRWPANRPKRGCHVGSRFVKGKCSICYCHYDARIRCFVKESCNATRSANMFTQKVKKKLTKYSTRQGENACVEGTYTRKDECNYCICFNGADVCTLRNCTINTIPECEMGRPVEDPDPCNDCICLNSEVLCTNNHCIGRTKKIPMYTKYKWKPPPKICKSRERYRIDNCNYCYCNAKKERVCDNYKCNKNKIDTRYPVNKPKRGCDVGTRWVRSKCKICYCYADVKIRCYIDRYACPTCMTSCIEGSSRQINRCNHCVCLRGAEFCTRKPCSWDTTSPIIFSEPECVVGEHVPAPDPCNMCICVNSDKLCTKRPCNGRRLSFASVTNFILNIDEHPYKEYRWVPPPILCRAIERYRLDNCNYCYCNEKRERVCENKVCDEKKNRPKRGCDIGSRFLKGTCEVCICHEDRKIRCAVNPNLCNNNTHTEKKNSTVSGAPGHLPDIHVVNASTVKNVTIFDAAKKILDSTMLLRFNSRRNMMTCTEGIRRQVNGCNYCICLRGAEFCTQKPCWKDIVRVTSPFKPECTVGKHVIPPDSCNVCICLDSKILCTNKMCIGRKSESLSGECIEGKKTEMADGCNYCLCEGGQEFCTKRACLQNKHSGVKKVVCAEGNVLPTEDGCNLCVCLGQNYFCTNKKCANEENLSRKSLTDGKETHRKLKMIQGTNQRCIEGKKYLPDDFDPNCPNECICDEQELMCTKKKCLSDAKEHTPLKLPFGGIRYRHGKQLLKPDNCVDYQPLQSDDPCNSCICMHGRKVCTIIPCNDVNEETKLSSDEVLLDKIRGRKHKGNMEKKKHSFCVPFTFFSPDNNRFCRNCFCLHNGLAFCLLNFCKYSKDITHQKDPEELDEVCTPGEIGYPTKCVRCTCSDRGKWICTREELSLCQERDCDDKDEFHMGFYPYCAGCKCSVKEWFCSIQDGPCRDYSNVTCPLGTFIHNPRQDCSICLCGGYEEGSHNMCFTEAKCVRQVGGH